MLQENAQQRRHTQPVPSVRSLGLSDPTKTNEGTISIVLASFAVTFEIGFSLFDSFAVVNAYIAWRNHILKDKPEKESKLQKYSIREARLKLIERWAKRCSRHYKRTRPHRNKRQRIVNIAYLPSSTLC